MLEKQYIDYQSHRFSYPEESYFLRKKSLMIQKQDEVVRVSTVLLPLLVKRTSTVALHRTFYSELYLLFYGHHSST